VKIVLISFISRSGSTLLANNLSKDSRFCVCPEAEILTDTLLSSPEKILTNIQYKKLLTASQSNYKLKYWNIDFPLFNEKITHINFFKLILKAYQKKHYPDSKIIVFKSERLENFKTEDYNEFYKIVLVRDPRAIYLSQKTSKSSIGNVVMNKNPIRIAKKTDIIYKSYIKTANRELLIKFEDYITNPIEESKRIANFFGIDNLSNDFEYRLLKQIPLAQKHLHVNIKRKMNPGVIDKWMKQLTEYEIYTIEKNCCFLKAAGYEKVIRKDQIRKTAYYFFVVKIVMKDIANKLTKKRLRILIDNCS